ncbi:MAG: DUF2778 domain-containing protein [Hyphomicrobiales bacterium]|nr:MAG: DUF2778 domain-containing protein [Hyphomicrobiales bacterium]
MHGVEFFLILLVGAPLGAAIWLGATVWPGRRAMSPGRVGAGLLLAGAAVWAAFTFDLFGPAPMRTAGPSSAEPLPAEDLAPRTTPAEAASFEDDGPALLPGLDRWTAVYDIATHTVYLPNGTMLEAHSGLGARMDDPRYVHEHMRGPTPPSVYALELREKPFHGVRALRLKPLDEREVYGRKGLLAHTYMLGPRGDSNGCVVFKDYSVFLQAFDAGELKRLAVVARLDRAILLQLAQGPQQRRPQASVAASGAVSTQ